MRVDRQVVQSRSVHHHSFFQKAKMGLDRKIVVVVDVDMSGWQVFYGLD